RLEAELREQVEAIRQKDRLRAHLRVAFADRVLELDLERLLGELRRGLASFWPLSWLRCRQPRAVLRSAATGAALGPNEELARQLEQAIELRRQIAALRDPAQPARAFFGDGLWRG